MFLLIVEVKQHFKIFISCILVTRLLVSSLLLRYTIEICHISRDIFIGCMSVSGIFLASLTFDL